MFKLIHQSQEYSSATLYQPAKRIEMTLDTQDASLDELLNFYQDFLRACGYTLGEGQLEMVPFEDDSAFKDDLVNQPADDEFAGQFSRNLDAEASAFADEYANGMINEEFTDNENVDTTGYEPVKEVQTEFNFEQKPQ